MATNLAMMVREILKNTELTETEKRQAISAIFHETIQSTDSADSGHECNVCFDADGTKLDCCEFRWCDMCMAMWIQESQINNRAVRCPQCRTPVLTNDIIRTREERPPTESHPQFEFTEDDNPHGGLDPHVIELIHSYMEEETQIADLFGRLLIGHFMTRVMSENVVSLLQICIDRHLRVLLFNSNDPFTSVLSDVTSADMKKKFKQFSDFACGIILHASIPDPGLVAQLIMNNHPTEWDQIVEFSVNEILELPKVIPVSTVWSEHVRCSRCETIMSNITYLTYDTSAYPVCRSCDTEYYAKCAKYAKYSSKCSKLINSVSRYTRTYISKYVSSLASHRLIYLALHDRRPVSVAYS